MVAPPCACRPLQRVRTCVRARACMRAFVRACVHVCVEQGSGHAMHT
jgi:hypothetical protein